MQFLNPITISLRITISESSGTRHLFPLQINKIEASAYNFKLAALH